MPTLSILGITLEADITYAHTHPATERANGSSELEYDLISGTDEIGETISRKGLDLISIQFQIDIERAIWAQIEGRRT
jgi:hypothetical protein